MINGTTELTGVIAIAGGDFHLLALRNDGTVWACGYNYYGEIGIGGSVGPGAVALNATQVMTSAGVPLTNVVSIAAGAYSSIAVKADGSVWTWGYNGQGQLGVGTVTDSSFAVQMLAPNGSAYFSSAQAVAAGTCHFLILKTDGTLWATGWNNEGQLGNGTINDQNLPVQVMKSNGVPLTNVVSMAGGYYHSVALDNTGTVYTWGYEYDGELGSSGTANTYVPYAAAYNQWAGSEFVQTAMNLTVTSTSSTDPGSFLLTAGPTNNIVEVAFYQGGTLLGTVTSGPWQLSVAGASWSEPFTAVAYSSTGVASQVGTAYGEVAAPALQLQAGSSATQFNVVVTDATPNAVIHYTTNGFDPTSNDPIVVSGGLVGISSNVIFKAAAFDGSTPSVLTPSTVTVAVYNVYGKVAAGDFETLELTFDGRIMASGLNYSGELGNGNTTTQYSPGPVLNSGAANDIFTNAISVSIGASCDRLNEQGVAAKSDGTVWCWGYNGYGGLGNGSIVTSYYPVQVSTGPGQPLTGAIMVSGGCFTSYALANGKVWAWGNNQYGELGNGGTTAQSYAVPVMINGATELTGVVAIAGGDFHLLALRNDGTVWACGYNNYGEIGNGDPNRANATNATQVMTSSGVPLTNVVSIAAGAYSSIAAKADGSVWSWGYNGQGQLGLGNANGNNDSGYAVQMLAPNGSTYFSGAQAVAAGACHFLILATDGTLWATGWNNEGQLGNGTTAAVQNLPVQVMKSAGVPMTNVVSMAGGYSHSVALDNTGTVYTWGYEYDGQLGSSGTANTFVSYAAAYNQWTGSLGSASLISLSLSPTTTVQPGSFTLTAAPMTSTSGISSVSFYEGGSYLGSVSSSPWQWPVSGLATGTYTFSAIASNSNGVAGVPATVTGVATNEASPAEAFTVSVSATGPFQAPANVVAVSNVTHPSTTSIAHVDFYLQGVLQSSVTQAPYELQMSNLAVGSYVVKAIAYDSLGNTVNDSTQFTVVEPNYYFRGGGNQYVSSIWPINFEIGIGLDNYYSGFSSLFPNQQYPTFPWFLRTRPESNEPYSHIEAQGNYQQFDAPQAVNGSNIGGVPPMVAFGAQGGGSALYAGQSYSFGVAAGGQIPSATTNNDIKIEVYQVSDFANGATNVAPVDTEYITLPRIADAAAWRFFTQNNRYVYYKQIFKTYNNKLIDFDTQIQYVTGATVGSTWGQFVQYPLMVTHKAGNALFCYKVSYMGYTSDAAYSNTTNTVVGSTGDVPMAVDSLGNTTYNASYTLDFSNVAPWQATYLAQPHFQGIPLPTAYAGQSVDQLIHNASPVTSSLTAPAQTGLDLTELNNSPELKVHPTLHNFVLSLNSDPLALANYVVNQINLTDAVGYNKSGVAASSVNPPGVSRDALATFLEGQGSPTEQCALLVYLLRDAGYACGYVFPQQNGTLMFDEQLSALLRMQIRGSVDQSTGSTLAPELIPVNYPWVAAYINNQWVHIFPWIKDTSMQEGADLWSYLPNGYQTGPQWLNGYLLNNPSIRGPSIVENGNVQIRYNSIAVNYTGNISVGDFVTGDGIPPGTTVTSITSAEDLTISAQGTATVFQTPLTFNSVITDDNPGTLFPIFVQKQLAGTQLSLDQIGMKIYNRQNYYTRWEDFPRPWVTPVISNANLAQSLTASQNPLALRSTLTDIFDTIQIQVISDRLRTGTVAGNPMVADTGTLRMVDLHDRRLLLYHQVIQGTAPTQYNMILSLEPFSSAWTGQYTFNGSGTYNGVANQDPGDLRNRQVINATLTGGTTAGTDDPLLYVITYNRNQQSGTYAADLLGTQEIETITDTRNLRVGDMACPLPGLWECHSEDD